MKNGLNLEGFAYNLDDDQEYLRIVEHNNEVVFARISEISAFKVGKPKEPVRPARAPQSPQRQMPIPPPRFQEQQDDQVSDAERAAIAQSMNVLYPPVSADNLAMTHGGEGVRKPKLERKT